MLADVIPFSGYPPLDQMIAPFIAACREGGFQPASGTLQVQQCGVRRESWRPVRYRTDTGVHELVFGRPMGEAADGSPDLSGLRRVVIRLPGKAPITLELPSGGLGPTLTMDGHVYHPSCRRSCVARDDYRPGSWGLAPYVVDADGCTIDTDTLLGTFARELAGLPAIQALLSN